MLVLSRRDGEQILVGDNVIIKVISVASGRVRVGIEAPREISIRRSEIEPHFVGDDINLDRVC